MILVVYVLSNNRNIPWKYKYFINVIHLTRNQQSNNSSIAVVSLVLSLKAMFNKFTYPWNILFKRKEKYKFIIIER